MRGGGGTKGSGEMIVDDVIKTATPSAFPASARLCKA